MDKLSKLRDSILDKMDPVGIGEQASSLALAGLGGAALRVGAHEASNNNNIDLLRSIPSCPTEHPVPPLLYQRKTPRH